MYNYPTWTNVRVALLEAVADVSVRATAVLLRLQEKLRLIQIQLALRQRVQFELA